MNTPASTTRKTANKKIPSKGFTFKERLVPSLLLAMLAPLTVCFVAPFEIYGNNFDEFKFVLGDFWALCLLIAFGAFLLLGGILLACRGKAFDVVYGLIFGLSLMFFIQGNYLSLGQSFLTGDGTGEGMSIGYIVLNTVIWILVTAACIVTMLLLNRFKGIVRLVATMATAVLLFMSFVSFMTIAVTTDVFATEKNVSTPTDDSEEQQVLTMENLDTLATSDNIVVFLVDRFDHRYYDEAMEECPEVFDELEGFTYFTDYISKYPRTFPGAAYMVTGEEIDFTLSREEYFEEAYSNSTLLHSLKAAGYDVNLYTETYYAYENIAFAKDYATNISGHMGYEIINRPRLSLDMIRLSLYRSLPSCFRFLVGDISSTTFDRYVVYNAIEAEVYTSDMKEVYDNMTDSDFTFRKEEKGYSIIHIAGCHLPNVYDENFNDADLNEEYSVPTAMKQSFKIINRYIQEMKRLGVYDDATIIITGDHASIGSDSKDPYYPHMTGLLVKPANATHEGIVSSNAQIAPEDIFATILQAAGSPAAADYGRTVFEIPENETRTRRYYFQRLQKSVGITNYEQIVYEITGPGADFNNWKIVDRYYLDKTIYQ